MGRPVLYSVCAEPVGFDRYGKVFCKMKASSPCQQRLASARIASFSGRMTAQNPGTSMCSESATEPSFGLILCVWRKTVAFGQENCVPLSASLLSNESC